jgi:zinc protease
LKDNLEESLQLFGDVVLNPTFPASEMPRLRSELLTNIQQEKSQPMGMALRVIPGILYGEDHPYAQPLTGSGTEASVKAITQQGLESWHQQWFRPNNATLIAVGDTSAADMKGRIERLFRNWRPGEIPQRDIARVPPRDLDTIYLIDRPGAVQSIIFAGLLIAPMNNPREVAIEAMNDVLGGQFSARINMNLREQKSWSYGARSMITTTAAQRPWLVYAPVQMDKTAPALAEIHRELSEFLGERPASDEELERIKRSNVLSLAGRWETNGKILDDLSTIVAQGLEDSYWNDYPAKLLDLSREDVNSAAEATLELNQITWVVVGDRARVERELRELGLGSIQLLDTEGNLLEATR